MKYLLPLALLIFGSVVLQAQVSWPNTLKRPATRLGNLHSADSTEEVPSSHQDDDDHTQAQIIEKDAHAQPDEDEHGHVDHGQKSSSLMGFLGKLHVIAIHFPIALIPFAGFSDIVFRVSGKASWKDIANTAFVSGSLASAVTASMGWIAALSADYADSLEGILFFHRWLGTSVAVLSLLGCSIIFWLPGPLGRKPVVRTTIFLLVSLITLTAAHFGGSLIYGPDYFF